MLRESWEVRLQAHDSKVGAEYGVVLAGHDVQRRYSILSISIEKNPLESVSLICWWRLDRWATRNGVVVVKDARCEA